MSILKKANVVSLLLGCIVMASGCGNSEGAVSNDTTVEQTVSQTPVEVMEVTEASIENKYIYSGTVKPVNEINVLSTVNGTVSSVHFDVGDYVKAGEVLFKMDTTDIQNSIKVTQASLATAEASINSAKTNLEYVNGSAMQSQIASAKNAVENAKISVSNAELTYNTAKADYDTYKTLYEAGAIAKANFDQYESAYKKAELALKQAQLSLTSAEESYEIISVKTPAENLRKAQDALASAQASKQSILAQIESYQKTLNDATITAPISGIIAQCNVKPNTVLAQGSTAPFVIIDLSSVNIEVNVAEQIIPYIAVGNEVDVLVSTVSPEYIKGNITSINPVSNPDGTYTVKVKIANESGRLKSGMFGEVYFAKEQSNNTIVLPRQAVMFKDDIYYVFIEKDGVAVRTEVEVGIDNGDVIEVTSGLTVGMNVITKGQNYLVDGEAVNVVSDETDEVNKANEVDKADATENRVETEDSSSSKEA